MTCNFFDRHGNPADDTMIFRCGDEVVAVGGEFASVYDSSDFDKAMALPCDPDAPLDISAVITELGPRNQPARFERAVAAFDSTYRDQTTRNEPHTAAGYILLGHSRNPIL